MSPDSPRKSAVTLVGLDTVPITPCNTLFVQYLRSHEFILTFGFGVPPLPDAEDRSVSATVSARVTLSHGRMLEFIELLRAMVKRFEQAQRAVQAADDVKHFDS